MTIPLDPSPPYRLAPFTEHQAMALSMMLDLAAHRRAGWATVNIHTLSARVGLPSRRCADVLGLLRQAGLVFSRIGPTGGYGLQKDPQEITVGLILEAVQRTDPSRSLKLSHPLLQSWMRRVSEDLFLEIEGVALSEVLPQDDGSITQHRYGACHSISSKTSTRTHASLPANSVFDLASKMGLAPSTSESS